MAKYKHITQEFQQTIVLAMPLIASLLAQVCMEFVDTVMMGRLGPIALAAGGLGSAIFITVFVLFLGFIISLGAFIARAYGERDPERITHITRQGLWLAFFLAIPGMIILWFFPDLLLRLGQEPQVIKLTQAYLHGLLWSLLPALVFIALREFVAAIHKPKIIMFISVPAIFLNAFLNYILMYGKYGLPKLGVAGIGYATTITELVMLMCLVLCIYLNRLYNIYKIFQGYSAPQWKTLKEIMGLGWPIGVMLIFEVGLFSVTAFLMGIVGTYTLAAYQIAVQCVSVVFMIPLGISQATTMRVSHALGEKKPLQAKNITSCSLWIGLVFAIINAILFICLGKQIIGLYINTDIAANLAVAKLALQFLYLSTIFLLMDAMQIISNGALRGLKDTLIPMFLGLFAYWGSGVACGVLFGFYFQLGGTGLWWGLIVGISLSGLLLLRRFYFKIGQEITNIKQ